MPQPRMALPRADRVEVEVAVEVGAGLRVESQSQSKSKSKSVTPLRSPALGWQVLRPVSRSRPSLLCVFAPLQFSTFSAIKRAQIL